MLCSAWIGIRSSYSSATTACAVNRPRSTSGVRDSAISATCGAASTPGQSSSMPPCRSTSRFCRAGVLPSLTIHVVPFVYILRCADGTLYTGFARDPKRREQVHNKGRGAKYTIGRRPVRLVYSEACRSVTQALRREYQVKQWTRARKEALIAGDVATPKVPRASSGNRTSGSRGRHP